MSNAAPFEQPTLRRFWPNYVTAALLTPAMWVLLIGLTLPDDVVGFYLVCIVAIPVVFALVVLPAWRIVRDAGNGVIVRIAAPVLALPTVAIFLWGIYTALLLAHIVLVEGI